MFSITECPENISGTLCDESDFFPYQTLYKRTGHEFLGEEDIVLGDRHEVDIKMRHDGEKVQILMEDAYMKSEPTSLTVKRVQSVIEAFSGYPEIQKSLMLEFL